MRAPYCLALAVAMGFSPCRAQELKPIALPRPRTDAGMPLMQALAARKSARDFSSRPLSLETLSGLLWAVFGVNRPDGRRTAPSAMNAQEIDIYVALPEGVYRFEPGEHLLNPVVAGDLRSKTGVQPFVGEAAVNLVYVADYARGKPNPEAAAEYASVDTGFIGQNVYLFCASEGLGTVFRASLDREGLAKAIHLRPDQHITFAQSVGYTKQ